MLASTTEQRFTSLDNALTCVCVWGGQCMGGGCVLARYAFPPTRQDNGLSSAIHVTYNTGLQLSPIFHEGPTRVWCSSPIEGLTINKVIHGSE